MKKTCHRILVQPNVLGEKESSVEKSLLSARCILRFVLRLQSLSRLYNIHPIMPDKDASTPRVFLVRHGIHTPTPVPRLHPLLQAPLYPSQTPPTPLFPPPRPHPSLSICLLHYYTPLTLPPDSLPPYLPRSTPRLLFPIPHLPSIRIVSAPRTNHSF